MGKFMDVHSGFVGVTAAQLEDAHGRDLAIEAEEGGGSVMKRVSVLRRLLPLVTVGAALVLVPAGVFAADADDLAAARAATEAFTDVAAAEAAGYGLPAEGPLHECIESLDDTGAMGLHYINGDLVGNPELDLTRPEALVYQPMAGGGLKLVALEYVVFAEAWDAANDHPPMLFGEMFMLTEDPNRYELPAFYALHVWLYEDNPAGMFASFNANVTCTILPDTATEPTAEATPATGLAPLAIAVLALVGVASAFLVRRDRGRLAP